MDTLRVYYDHYDQCGQIDIEHDDDEYVTNPWVIITRKLPFNFAEPSDR